MRGMSPAASSRHGFATVVMGMGALFFAASLLVAARAYVVTFGEPRGPWSLRDGLHPIFIDTILFTIFALHHSIFARTGLRRQIAALASDDMERPVYVIVASVLLALVIWFWQPVPGVLWAVSGLPSFALTMLQVAGLGVVLVAASQLGIRRLSGLGRNGPTSEGPTALRATGLYGFVRHPIYFAWLLMVWPVPMMTGSRLTFAAISTLYLMLAVPFEERTLRQQFGPAYDEYRRQIRWRMFPWVY